MTQDMHMPPPYPSGVKVAAHLVADEHEARPPAAGVPAEDVDLRARHGADVSEDVGVGPVAALIHPQQALHLLCHDTGTEACEYGRDKAVDIAIRACE